MRIFCAFLSPILARQCSCESVLYEKQGQITLIGLNKAATRNALDAQMVQKLDQSISRFEADKESPVGVLYGLGGSFCAGYDLKEIREDGISSKSSFPVRITYNISFYFGLIFISFPSQFPSRRIISKPMICAVSGFCVGNGFELALMCDLRVIEHSAVMGFLNRRFGVPIIDGGTARLPQMIGLSRAMDLILTGRALNAQEANEMGLACRLVATGTSLGQAVNVAVQVAKFPQAALLHDRSSIYRASYNSEFTFSQLAAMESKVISPAIDIESKEGAHRFLDGQVGRGGKFYNIRQKTLADWETDEIAFEKNANN